MKTGIKISKRLIIVPSKSKNSPSLATSGQHRELTDCCRAKDAKAREMFEKVFPDIRKQRVQQERTDRAGTRGDTCRSEAEFAEIVVGLTEQVRLKSSSVYKREK